MTSRWPLLLMRVSGVNVTQRVVGGFGLLWLCRCSNLHSESCLVGPGGESLVPMQIRVVFPFVCLLWCLFCE